MSLIVGAFRSARAETRFADADVGFKKLKTATLKNEIFEKSGGAFNVTREISSGSAAKN